MTAQDVDYVTDSADLLDPGLPFSRVDRFSRFEGRYEAMQNLLVEGTCSGEIDCRGMLVVAQGARIDARVTARDIRVAGTIDGQLECSGRFELMPSGRASGSVTARQIVVHEGAQYDGELQMTGPVGVAEPEPAVWESTFVAPDTVATEPAPEPAAPPEDAGEPARLDALVEVPEFLRPRRTD